MQYSRKNQTGQAELQPNVDEIRRALDVLFEADDVVEVRAFKDRRCTISGYYSDFDKLANDAATINRQAGAVYVTLNRIRPELLARRANRYEQYADTTTSDEQVILRRWFPIDLDPVRPAGISASNEEHNAAIERARQVRKYLVQELGWPEPVAADSGNGAHLDFRIDLPNDDEAAELVQAGLQALDLKFSDGMITVDTGNYNAARIWKLYGTATGKGDHTDDRPHRQARLLHVPEAVEVVPIEKLRALAAMVPKVDDDQHQPGRPSSGHHNANGKLDVAEWIRRHNIPVRHHAAYSGRLGRGTKWILERCQWNTDHTDKAAYVIQFDDGRISAGCHHNGCQGRGWHDLRDAAEPGWRDRRSGRPAHQPGRPADTPKQRPIIPPSWRPFPIEVLPDPVRCYVQCSAAAIGCDTSYVVVPMLAALASAIGNTRQIELKRTWCEPAVLWCAVVGDSGTMKSPAMDAATLPIKRRQARAVEKYEQAMSEYEADLEAYKLALDDWKRKGKNRDQQAKPEEPKQPVCHRIYVSDITVEALADRLRENPRGLLLVRDELAGWIRSFDQYKGGRGADTAHWLSMYGARDMLVDRKTGDRKMIFVPRAAVSICGGIQPEVLHRALGTEHYVDGLAPRLLLSMPPRRRKKWSKATVDRQVKEQVDEVLDRLLALDAAQGENGHPEPVSIKLTAEAERCWGTFYDQHAAEQVEATGERAAVLSKIEGAAARLALVVHLIRWAVDHSAVDHDQVDEASIDAGVAIARWFAHEAERVYMVLHESDLNRERRQIIELIERKGRSITPRELRQSMRRFKDSTDEAEQALDDLAKAGYGCWEPSDPGAHGGRPTRVFQLSTPSTVYETPSKPEKTGGFVDVDTVDAPQINLPIDETVEAEDPDEVVEWTA